MATTALFVEILIIGLEAAIWLLLLGLTLTGSPIPKWNDLQDHAKTFKDWAALATVLGLGGAYVLGIIVDRLAEPIHRWFEGTRPGRRVNWHWGRGSAWHWFPAGVGEMRMTVMHESPGMAGFLDYQRSRVRIVRATVLNVVLTLLVAIAYMAMMWPSGTAPWTVAVLGSLGVLLLVASVLASEQAHAAYLERLCDAYCVVTKRTVPATYDTVAAAVCYRRDAQGLQFLLVKTSGDDPRWTFPKGHIEDHERGTPSKAAAREAREEAGVEGDCSRTAFTHYLYARPAAGGGKREDRVAAYLLEVRSERGPEEAFRAPRWFSAGEARRHLAERRERRYACEHARVLDAAERCLADGARSPV